eukprot:2309559-Pyramimonas_sp.AAC.1
MDPAQNGSDATTLAPGLSREVEFNITHINPNLRGHSNNVVSRYRDSVVWIPSEPPMWGTYDSTDTNFQHTLRVGTLSPR